MLSHCIFIILHMINAEDIYLNNGVYINYMTHQADGSWFMFTYNVLTKFPRGKYKQMEVRYVPYLRDSDTK